MFKINFIWFIYYKYVKISVSVFLMLEWASLFDIDVVSLFLGKNGKFSTEGWEMKSGNLLVELLW